MPLSVSPLLRRERVLARLAAAQAHPVTLLIAPAGSGKTVALQQFLEGIDAPVVRFDVRPAHATLAGFARGLGEAFARVTPLATTALFEAVDALLRGEAPAAAIAQWIAERIASFDGIVAVDDLHFADGDARCAELVVETIALTKRRARWIVSSRSAAQLPVSSWLVYGDAAVPITEADLRLTADEARAAAAPAGLEQSEVDRLLAQTGGWITAFGLALNALGRSSEGSDPADAGELSYHYLAEQVFASLAPEERELLLFCSTLPEIDVEVAERAGFARARPIFDDIRRSLSFLSVAPADAAQASPRRYRCHDLFRDFLERELERSGAERARAARMRAAQALADCGYHVAALRIYADLGATAPAVALLQEHGFGLHEEGHADTLRYVLDALPAGESAGDPVLLGLRGMQEGLDGRYDRAVEWYERAVARATDPALRAHLLARLSLATLNTGKNPIAMLEAVARDASLPVGLRGELLSLLAMTYGRFGVFDSLTTELLDEIERLATATDSTNKRTSILHRMGIAAYLLGDGPRATQALSRAAELAISSGRYRLAAIVYANLSEHQWTNELDGNAARASIALATEAAASAGDTYIARYVIGRWLALEMFCGDAAVVRSLLDEYARLPGPPRPVDTAPPRAMLAAWEGRFDEACGLHDAIRDGLWNQDERIYEAAWSALCAAATGDAERAARCVRDADEEARQRRSPRRYYDCMREIARSFCAIAEALSGRIAAAERRLRAHGEIDWPVARAARTAALAIVGDAAHGVFSGVPAAQAQILRSHHHGGIVATIDAAIRRRRDAAHAEVTLTPAEASVLRSLAQGASPKEVALAMGCTVHTVRWHIRRSIAKFGCSGRDQAVRAARARGLL
ncbi:MAG TPA: LuxR C-terminal-related transcriptional regulator [Verrucomicrobiae bacterium]|nr:LuxR C-terminal-related transcriptional regulator [Verrucomicrobiae bacterium]